jgi:transposase-like protein
MNQNTVRKRSVKTVRKWTSKEREQLLREYTSSGMSAWSFAKSRGITPNTFYTWIKKQGVKTQAKPRFTKLEVSTVPEAAPVEIIFSNGVRVRFGPDLPTAKLSEWIEVLNNL